MPSTRRSALLSSVLGPLLVLGADIAAANGEWRRVGALLGSAPWLDTAQDGRGHVLLARAALARSDEAGALAHARKALACAAETRQRGLRLALLGSAYERIGRADSARVAYDRAADSLPAIADWLRLR